MRAAIRRRPAMLVSCMESCPVPEGTLVLGGSLPRTYVRGYLCSAAARLSPRGTYGRLRLAGTSLRTKG